MNKRILAILTAVIMIVSTICMPAAASSVTAPAKESAVEAAGDAKEEVPAGTESGTTEAQTAEPSAPAETQESVPEGTGTAAQGESAQPSAETPTSETPASETETAPETDATDPEAPAEEVPAETEETAEETEEEGLLETQTEEAEYVDLPNGYYTIVTGVSDQMVLDVAGASLNNSANIAIYTSNNTPAQIFELKGTEETYTVTKTVPKTETEEEASGETPAGGETETPEVPVTDGTEDTEGTEETEATETITEEKTRKAYTFRSYCTPGKVIDVKGAKRNNSTNVQQYEANGTLAQKWYIRKGVQEGTYIIESALTTEEKTLVLDVKGAKTANSTNVQIYEANGTKAQDWKLKPVTVYEPKVGIYSIVTSDGAKALNVEGNGTANYTNVNVEAASNASSQAFRLKALGYGGYYSLIGLASQNAVDVKGAKKAAGTNIDMYTPNGTNAQYFRFVQTGETAADGSPVFNLVSKVENMPAGINGSNVELSKTPAKWYLKKADTSSLTAEPAEGIYFIATKLNTGKVVDIKGAGMANKVLAQIYTKNSTNAQRFRIAKTSDGYFKITSINSGRLLNVNGAKKADGTTVWQYEDDDTTAVKWKLIPTEDADGSFYLQFHETGYVLTVPNGSTADATQLKIYKNDGSTKQKFFFIKTTTAKGWQNYYGKYRYVYDGNGSYYKNTTVDGVKVGADGTVTEQWLQKNGYWRYQKADGTIASDVRPYLGKLFGTQTVSGQTAPKVPGYYATVDRARCLVTIYTTYPGTSGWNLPVCAFKCSPGRNETPTDPGLWRTQVKYRWKELMGPSYGQYCTRIHGGELFHSIACQYANNHNVDPYMYNALGTKQSHGCVRLCVRNAYWIYTFCPLGMNVRIGDNLANPLSAVYHPKMRSTDHIDPTDPAYTGNYGYTDTSNYYYK